LTKHEDLPNYTIAQFINNGRPVQGTTKAIVYDALYKEYQSEVMRSDNALFTESMEGKSRGNEEKEKEKEITDGLGLNSDLLHQFDNLEINAAKEEGGEREKRQQTSIRSIKIIPFQLILQSSVLFLNFIQIHRLHSSQHPNQY